MPRLAAAARGASPAVSTVPASKAAAGSRTANTVAVASVAVMARPNAESTECNCGIFNCAIRTGGVSGTMDAMPLRGAVPMMDP